MIHFIGAGPGAPDLITVRGLRLIERCPVCLYAGSLVPAGEELSELARSRATLAIHLSIANLAKVVRELTPVYGADCPVAVVHRASWPDQRILRGTLADIRAQAKEAGLTRTAIILVGRALGASSFAESRLYSPEHSHVFRP